MPGSAGSKALRILIAVMATAALVWGVATAALYAAMLQTPAQFGRVMSHVPMMTMMVLPFRPLWMSARAGHLAVGDPAPDFTLPLLHSDRRVTLSEEVRQKPVVLIFGSYT
jgi:hypothetical protein